MATPFERTARTLAAQGAGGAWLLWGLALLCGAAWCAWFTLGQVTVYEVSRRARIEAAQTPRVVASLVAGRMSALHASLGARVRAGEVLVSLDGTAAQLRRKEEQARLDALPGRIDSLRREIAALERAGAAERDAAAAALGFARDNERRLRADSAAGGVAQIEALRAAAETRRLETEARARALQQAAQLESQQRAVLVLEGELATARATLERLGEELERLQVRAPVSGIIGELAPLRAGAYVAEGQKLATVVPDGELGIVADFEPAAVLGRMRPGQRARLRLDGFPWAQYGSLEATVVRVASEIRDDLIRVELAPVAASPGALLQHGLPGVVEVAVEQTSPALLTLRAAGQIAARPPAAAASGTRGSRQP